GATGATSNPIIVADLIKTGRFDRDLEELLEQRLSDEQIAWRMTDKLVSEAQAVFRPVWEQTQGNDGYVSFELDPLLEDPAVGPPHAERVARYIELGKFWSKGQVNRMMKVPATPAGIEALEPLAADGITLNVTLTFTTDQYRQARDAIWRGAQRSDHLGKFKSVYSIFVSRVDVYTEQHVPQLSAAAQGQVGIVGAKRIWADNRDFWRDKKMELDQEIVFASTGTKKASDPPWKYAAAFAGSDIETNPPATNDAVEKSGLSFKREIDQLPDEKILAEIDRAVNVDHLHETLMAEGIKKFTDPQKALLALIAQKRKVLAGAS
ncbi:MAG TPA: transaldolase family protein, partial [Pirellulales bacterium]|nr:transaldolase family protein [Pirellulales bacterium]